MSKEKTPEQWLAVVKEYGSAVFRRVPENEPI